MGFWILLLFFPFSVNADGFCLWYIDLVVEVWRPLSKQSSLVTTIYDTRQQSRKSTNSTIMAAPLPPPPRPTSQTVCLNNFDFVLHTWVPPQLSSQQPSSSAPVKGLVVLFHGFLGHGLRPTVRYAAELLVAAQYAVVAPDLRGHGQSPGLPGYLPGKDILLEDGVAIVRYCQTELFSSVKQQCFLIGSSMGGTIALAVAQRMRQQQQQEQDAKDTIAGVVLMAPMLQLSVSSLERYLLYGLTYIVPTLPIIPSSSTDPAVQYRDKAKREECERDESSVVHPNGKLRVGSASTCVELAHDIRNEFSSVQTPFLVMVADEDVVVTNQGSFDLYEQAPETTDKMLKRYPALHGLLCEPSPLVDTIQKDLLEWIEARS